MVVHLRGHRIRRNHRHRLLLLEPPVAVSIVAVGGSGTTCPAHRRTGLVQCERDDPAIGLKKGRRIPPLWRTALPVRNPLE